MWAPRRGSAETLRNHTGTVPTSRHARLGGETREQAILIQYESSYDGVAHGAAGAQRRAQSPYLAGGG